jgi:hypothetical protein
MTEPTQYWWCLDHETVETDEGCANTVRLGPFPGPMEASHALEAARQRSEEWDSDPAWNDEPDES